MSIDWRVIRTINGSRSRGFEEFCCQLARAETAGRGRFFRKGDPDAGVECYTQFDSGCEWGWQAKYFLEFGETQWRQVDRSVRTALEKHPRLERYIVCLPMDLADGRIEGQESAREKWLTRVEKWGRWASDQELDVEFEYWGGSELLERLASPEHAGRVRFWFGAVRFDEDWFARRLAEATETAGPRYTAEVHVELPIAGRFEAFGRTGRFFDERIRGIRELGSGWANACSFGPSRLGREVDPEVEAGIVMVSEDEVVQGAKKSIGKRIGEAVALGDAMEIRPSGPLGFEVVAQKVAAVTGEVDGAVEHLLARQPEHRVFGQYRHQFAGFAERLRKVRIGLLDAERWGRASVMILQGQAGTGKTHLLCDVAHRRLSQGRPTVVLMGQSFTGDEAPWQQAAALLDLGGISAEEFVGALECAAQAADARALVVIDALNEGKGAGLWATHLSAFLARFARSEWVGVVLSIRSSYEGMIPEKIRENAAVATHSGFGTQRHEAMRTFFEYYGLKVPANPLLAPEFGNPLFLKTLCLGLRDKDAGQSHQTIQGITAIFDLYLSSVDARIAGMVGAAEWSGLARKAVQELARAFPGPAERWLAVEEAEPLVNALLPGRTYETSLYVALLAEGVLVRDMARARGGKAGREAVFIAYDRLADHLVTGALLDDHLEAASPESAFEPGGGLVEIGLGGYDMQGILEALCVQLAERTGREVADLIPRLSKLEGFEAAFRQSLVWRDASSISPRTRELVRARLDPRRGDLYAILGTLLTVATVDEHLLNARFLDARLREDDMAARDGWWSVYLSGGSSVGGAAGSLLDWAMRLDPRVALPDGLVDLAARTLAWMLTTSNRPVRDAATRALVNLLTGRLDCAAELVDGFAEVDDPYVTERVYAVAYGVAMRSQDRLGVGGLGEGVYSRVFRDGYPPANILLRDYARGVVERALHLESPIDVDPNRARPPYQSAPPVFPNAEEVAHLLPSPDHNPHRREGEDWARSHIGQSVLEGALHSSIGKTWGCSGEWLSLGLEEEAWSGSGAGEEADHPTLDRAAIERYVLHRVFDLGWTPELFGRADRRHDVDAIGLSPGTESIGRKYQWIAYREVLALVADHFQYREYPAGEERAHRYQGP